MKKLWKILKYLGVIALIIIALDAATVLAFAHFRPPINKADAIIVLGAAINTPALYNRSIQALTLYQQGKGDVLVLSGGRISDKDISEAHYMRNVILANSLGQPPKMLLEENSHTTYENIKNSKIALPGAKSVIVVSDDFHLARAALTAIRAGFYPVYWSSPPPNYYSDKDLLYYYFREMAAMLDYLPKFILNK